MYNIETRKINIPFTNFIAGTVISPSQMNTNFDEVEYCFNELYEDLSAFVGDVYTKLQADSNISGAINSLRDELNANINTVDVDLTASINNTYNSFLRITDSEILGVLTEVPIEVPVATYITSEQITNILEGITI
ncbi:hypothetical protein [Romboutsia sp.]|uniref:hypothetical protein n=1 Tax=Romboutsia sp. TaxID=1965302 RepID=UPI002C805914|nr:hypothetical protein [Romboutsia sp.]HSQ90156.1 hypothetical protein [Romboutsia sp.]